MKNKNFIITLILIIAFAVIGAIIYIFFKPIGNKITVNGVQVNNPEKIKNANQPNNESVIENSDFKIIYYQKFNYFDITILSQDFNKGRTEAEQQLLTSLGISKDEACKLNVKEGTTADINPELAGQDFNLSFCNKSDE